MLNNRSARAAQVLTALGKALAYLVLFWGFQFLVSLVFALIALTATLLTTGNLDPLQFLQQVQSVADVLVLIANLLTLLFLLIFFAVRKKHLLAEVNLRPVALRAAAAGAAVAPLFYAAVTLIMSFLPEAWLLGYAQASAGLTGGGVLSAISIALVSPVVEEVIFRGLVQSRLARAMPGWPAVLIASALFALGHGHPVWMGYAFCIGLFLGIMAWRTGSILPGLITHVIFNAIGQILSLPQLMDVSGLVILAVLAIVGILACLAARKGLALLFFPSLQQEADAHD